MTSGFNDSFGASSIGAGGCTFFQRLPASMNEAKAVLRLSERLQVMEMARETQNTIVRNDDAFVPTATGMMGAYIIIHQISDVTSRFCLRRVARGVI